jgi:hypothetical protein
MTFLVRSGGVVRTQFALFGADRNTRGNKCLRQAEGAGRAQAR